MYSINICNDIIGISNIQRQQLAEIQSWFNDSEEYRYATGLDGAIPYVLLERSFFGIEESSREFYLGISELCDKRLIGIISGKRRDNLLWITIMAVSGEHRNKGYGSIAIKLLLEHLRDECGISEVYLSVAGKNTAGRNFWRKNGFGEVKRIGDRVIFNESGQTIYIMGMWLD